MKLGNVVLRCAFLQIFIVFALYSYAQSTNEDVHKYKMIEAINSGNFEEAAKEFNKVDFPLPFGPTIPVMPL